MNWHRVGQTSGDPSRVFALSLDALGRTVAASNAVAAYAYTIANCGIATNETAEVGALSLDICRAVDPCGRIVSLARDGVSDRRVYNPSNGTLAAISNDEATMAYAYTGDMMDAGYSLELAVSNRCDHLDRRVQKNTPAATHTYFYDGWMLIKELVANTNGTTDVIEYHWGKDLSGTIGGAGGVGGLLYLSISNSSTPNSSTTQLYVPWYDAYGNVMGYWDAQGNVVAEYTYDAFGKLISSSGPMADVFSFRYSTKYYDSETGFYYYGYRFYSPELLRWITRDPIGEEGGVNLYAMCGNNPLYDYDVDGYKPASKNADSSWTLFGSVNEIHSWNCPEWPTLTDGSSCGTQAKYVAHFQKVTFAKNIKVSSRYVTLFSYGIVSALEMNKDTKSAWCLSLAPLEVWRKKRNSGGFDYKVVMTITNLDKHPTLKAKPEIPIKSYIGKKVEYNPYGK